ncbi:hypothetical protein KCU89_g1842, partial [Aureobasidium melanogenum]
MKNTRAYYFWVALSTLMGSAVSEKADCRDGLELNTRQGDQSTFSIPLNETCSAALITFSDGTDLVLDLRTNSSCPYASSEAQTFTTVIGSDTPEGVATLTFQCGGQVYCMSIDVVTANTSDSQTSIQSVCVDLTETARESLGAAAGSTQASGVSNGSTPEGSMMTSTAIRSSPSQVLQGNSSMTKALLGSSTGFSTIRGATELGNTTNATSLNNPHSSLSSPQSGPIVSDGTTLTTTAMVATFSSGTSYPPTFQTAMASLDKSDTIVPTTSITAPSGVGTTTPPAATSLIDGNDLDPIATANQLPEESQPVESNYMENPTALPTSPQPLGNGTTLNLPTQQVGQDPSTCACYPLPTP